MEQFSKEVANCTTPGSVLPAGNFIKIFSETSFVKTFLKILKDFQGFGGPFKTAKNYLC